MCALTLGGLAGQLNIETVLQNMPKPGQKS